MFVCSYFMCSNTVNPIAKKLCQLIATLSLSEIGSFIAPNHLARRSPDYQLVSLKEGRFICFLRLLASCYTIFPVIKKSLFL